MAECKKCVSEKVCRYNDGHNLYCKEDYECPNFKNKADVVEVRHGEWKMRGGLFRCSVCDGKALLQDVGGTGGFSHEYEQVKSSYCPHCLAKMDGKESGNTTKIDK